MTSACVRHPDRDGTYYCQKDDQHLCPQCARCHNPRIYCQFRTACVIERLAKEGELPKTDQNDPRDDESC